MIYVSELTGRQFETEKECLEHEKEVIREREEKAIKEAALKEERSARAKEIEEARAKVVEAEKHYRELVKKFAEDYDSYHISITTKNVNDMIDEMFKFF